MPRTPMSSNAHRQGTLPSCAASCATLTVTDAEFEALVAENETMRCERGALRLLKAALVDDERRLKAKRMLLDITLKTLEG